MITKMRASKQHRKAARGTISNHCIGLIEISVQLLSRPAYLSCCYSLHLGFGDYSSDPTGNCDISKLSLTVLYICVIISTIPCLCLIVRYLVIRSIGVGEHIYISSSDPKKMFPWIFLLELLLQLVFAALKISDPNRLVGYDFAVSFVLEGASFFAFLGLTFYFFVVVRCLKSYHTKFLNESKEKIYRFFTILTRLCLTIPPLAFVSGTIVVVASIRNQNREEIFLCCLIGKGILTLGYGIITTLALNYLCRELSIHVKLFPEKSDDVKLILNRLRFAYRIMFIMTISMGFSAFLFSFGKFRPLSSYLIIFFLITWPPSSTILILTVSRISRVNRSENNENNEITPASLERDRNIERRERIDGTEIPHDMLQHTRLIGNFQRSKNYPHRNYFRNVTYRMQMLLKFYF